MGQRSGLAETAKGLHEAVSKQWNEAEGGPACFSPPLKTGAASSYTNPKKPAYP